MAIEPPSSLTDVELLHQYLGERIDSGSHHASLNELLTDFADYHRELEDLREKLQAAEASSRRGESKPLDVDAVLKRVHQRALSC
jgi:hypothetical protein